VRRPDKRIHYELNEATAFTVAISSPGDRSFFELLQALRGNDCCISLDVGWHEVWLRDEGVKAVVLKLGSRGAGMPWQDRISFVEPPRRGPGGHDRRGDCFDAGFLHGWLKAEDAETCLRAAAICGALSTEALGGLNGFPSRERLEAELRAECAK
jgi:sugar/nucleoside kinase (ribokinase family)